jgi:hypothetical protein
MAHSAWGAVANCPHLSQCHTPNPRHHCPPLFFAPTSHRSRSAIPIPRILRATSQSLPLVGAVARVLGPARAHSPHKHAPCPTVAPPFVSDGTDVSACTAPLSPFPPPPACLCAVRPRAVTSVLPVARWGSAAKQATGRGDNPPHDSARREQQGGTGHIPVGASSAPLHSAAGGRSVRPSLGECAAAQHKPRFEPPSPLLYVAAPRCTETSGTPLDAPGQGAPSAGWEN